MALFRHCRALHGAAVACAGSAGAAAGARRLHDEFQTRKLCMAGEWKKNCFITSKGDREPKPHVTTERVRLTVLPSLCVNI